MNKVADDVWQIPLTPRNGVNAYLVGDILIDAGYVLHGRKLLSALQGRAAGQLGVALAARALDDGAHAHASDRRPRLEILRTAGWDRHRGDDVARREEARAGRGVVLARAGGRERVRARRGDGERGRAHVVRRGDAGLLVGEPVAVVVLAVAADLRDLAAHERIGLVAIGAHDAVIVGVAVAVGVARRMITALGGVDAAIDGARVAVLAGDHCAGGAASAEDAFLRAVAV